MIAVSDVEKFVRFYNSEFGKQILIKEAEYLKRELRGQRKILKIRYRIGYFGEILSSR